MSRQELADITFRAMMSHILIAFILLIIGVTELVTETGIFDMAQGVALVVASLLALYAAYQLYTQWRIYSWASI